MAILPKTFSTSTLDPFLHFKRISLNYAQGTASPSVHMTMVERTLTQTFTRHFETLMDMPAMIHKTGWLLSKWTILMQAKPTSSLHLLPGLSVEIDFLP